MKFQNLHKILTFEIIHDGRLEFGFSNSLEPTEVDQHNSLSYFAVCHILCKQQFMKTHFFHNHID